MAISERQLKNAVAKQRGVKANMKTLYTKASPRQKGALAKAMKKAEQAGGILATCAPKHKDSIGRNYRKGRNAGDKSLCSDAGRQLKKADIGVNKIFKGNFFSF